MKSEQSLSYRLGILLVVRGVSGKGSRSHFFLPLAPFAEAGVWRNSGS